MKYVDNIKIGDTGYVIHKREIIEVTVSSIVDISYHGSASDVFFVKEISGEYFRDLYDLNEVKEALLKCLEFDKHRLEDDKESILYNIKQLNKKINRLKKEII